jgi:hypothetical protein
MTTKEQQEIIDYSITGSYPGLYPDRLKNNSQKLKSQRPGKNTGLTLNSNNGVNYDIQRRNIEANVTTCGKQSAIERVAQNTRELKELRTKEAGTF